MPDWDNPNILTENKQKNKAALKMKLRQRMDPDEADQRAIINKNELFSNKVCILLIIFYYIYIYHHIYI